MMHTALLVEDQEILEQTIARSVRIKFSLNEELKKAAELDGRSVEGQIRYYITQQLQLRKTEVEKEEVNETA